MMPPRDRRLWPTVTLLILVAPAAAARGASSPSVSTFAVSATVDGSCRIETTGASEGGHALTASPSPDAEIHLACTSGVSARLAVDTPGAEFFRDRARTEAWGAGEGLEPRVVMVGAPRRVTFAVYGRARAEDVLRRAVDGVAEVLF